MGLSALSYIDGMGKNRERRRDRYDVSDNVEGQYVDAAKAAFKRRYDPMIEIIRQALARAKSRP